SLMLCHSLMPMLFPYTTLFRSLASFGFRRRKGKLDGSGERKIGIATARKRLAQGAEAGLRLLRGSLAVNFESDGTAKVDQAAVQDRKSTRLNSSHLGISYAVFC